MIAVIDGGRARELFLSCAAADLSREVARPIVVVASPGVALTELLQGFMSRAPADVLCFNAENERAAFVAAADEIGVDSSNAIVTGLLGLDRRPRQPNSDGRPCVVFFEQPVIPARRMQRMHLLAGMIDLARRSPGTDVLIKLRHARNETAHHPTRFHLDDLSRELLARGGRPENLHPRARAEAARPGGARRHGVVDRRRGGDVARNPDPNRFGLRRFRSARHLVFRGLGLLRGARRPLAGHARFGAARMGGGAFRRGRRP
ncbi:hypothetical protein K6K41_27380 [Chenggangzhangella methanolivorans]|uniref:Uncharacterized protein n=1 Tax=Chenggangzhangella methanolivorans TaxID=1437009 RepID=A0A9E6UHX6_9HYPH|nr:DUF6716 putative glycosyltransferase [Chenggangzhangella methanolivorans]QZO00198.1 hypothetical protein K6K41_27380 [Chenggangzhangella methanolivorans]